MADPTPEEVRAALAILAAAETARESHVYGAAPVEPVKPSEPFAEPNAAQVEQPAAAVVVAEATSAPTLPAAPIDPYLARSVKSSPNGF